MAKTIKGITIEIEGKTSGLVKALAQVDKQVRDTENALKQVEKALELDPSNLELLESKQKVLNDAIEETRKKLELEKQAAEKAKEALLLGKISEADYATVISNVQTTTSKLEGLEQQARETNDGIKQIDDEPIKAVGSSAELSTKKMDALKDAAHYLKAKLDTVSSATRNFLTNSFNSFKEYEDAFIGVTKTIDETATTSYEDISDAIKNMAVEMGVSKTEIAGVAEAAGQLGVSADEVIDFTETMVKMGMSTDLGASDAAMALAKLFAVLGEDLDDVDRAGATIVALGNNFETTEASIMDMATRLAATGAVVGLSTDQILAISTALSSVGIEAEAGGSAISKLLKKMDVANATYKKSSKTIDDTGYSLRELELMAANDTKAFKGLAVGMGLTTTELKTAMSNVKSLTQYANVAGMTAEDFARAYGKDAVGALGSFINGLSDMDASGESATAMLQEMGLTEVRLSNAILALSTSNDKLTATTQMASEAWSENNALNEEAGKRIASTSRQVQGAWERLDNLKIEIGEKLAPILLDLLEKVKDIIDWFSNLDDGTKSLIVGFGILVAAIGPITTAIGGVISAVKILAPLFTATGAGGLGSALVGLVAKGGPIALAVAGIAGLSAVVLKVISDMKELNELRSQAERIQQNVADKQNELRERYRNNPAKSLAADTSSEEYGKAVAAYKYLGFTDEYIAASRERAIVIYNTTELNGEVVGQNVNKFQASTNKMVYGGT